MGTEIERKFLIKNDSWRARCQAGKRYRQGYFGTPGKASLRVRVAGDKAHLNIKSAELSIRRTEYEYEIPLADADDMLDRLCEHPLVEKTRYLLPLGEHVWEIDEFSGDNQGLLVAEIELTDEREPFTRPDWLGEEVSDDARYYNVNLGKHPYKDW